MNQLTIFCLILGLISWYYFNKFQDSEKEYNKLHKRFEQVYMENQGFKSRIKDLQSYKNDVSKTFKILDNELVMINDHLKRQNENESGASARQRPPLPPRPQVARSFYMRNIPNNNVSLLTPDLLTSLFNMNTSEGTLSDEIFRRQGIFGNNLSQTSPQQQTQQMQPQTNQQLQQQTQQTQPQTDQQLQEQTDQQLQEQTDQQLQEPVGEQTDQQLQTQEMTEKLDLNIDMDKIGMGDNVGDYDKYIM
jgi:septal ring factor EnvC (AmiA/AmiB activator)